MADRRQIALALAVLAIVGAGGCTTLPPIDAGPVTTGAAADRFVQVNHRAVDRLLISLHPDKEFLKNQPIIVATIVNIDDLKGSRFGRAVAENVSTRLTQRGYPVIELKLRGTIFVKQSEGELLLSRELQDISLNHKAQAVVVGTYTEAKNHVFVSLKMIEAATGQAIAAHDYTLPVDSALYSMLGHEPR